MEGGVVEEERGGGGGGGGSLSSGRLSKRRRFADRHVGHRAVAVAAYDRTLGAKEKLTSRNLAGRSNCV